MRTKQKWVQPEIKSQLAIQETLGGVMGSFVDMTGKLMAMAAS
jgi:hypothetical protein